MDARLLLAVMIMAAVGLSATAYTLRADCTPTADAYGYTELQAIAKYFPNSVSVDDDGDGYCYNTNVTVTVDGTEYAMNGYYDCAYSGLAQLPIGQHSASFKATYNDGHTETRTCLFNTTTSAPLGITAYSPADNANYYGTVPIEAVGTLDGEKVHGATATADLFYGTTLMQSITLAEPSYGVYEGRLALGQFGQYRILISLSYRGWSTQRWVNISSVSQDNVTTQPGTESLRIDVLYPATGNYSAGQELALTAKVYDQAGFTVTGGTMAVNVYRDEQSIENITLTESRYFFMGRYTPQDTGTYEFRFIAAKGSMNATRSVFIGVGGSPAEIANFTVMVISPRSDVYAENSSLIVRARAFEKTTLVTDANVTAYIGNDTVQLEYSRDAYEGVLPQLAEGEHELVVVAQRADKIAEAKVIFQISKHYVHVTLLKPIDSVDIIKDEPVRIEADVTDEEDNIVSGALVVFKILDPAGRESEMQLFQSAETAKYSSVFYPTVDGTHQITVEVSKPGYVSDAIESNFDVAIKRESWFPFSIDKSTLLTIVIGLAAIILFVVLIRIIL